MYISVGPSETAAIEHSHNNNGNNNNKCSWRASLGEKKIPPAISR